MIMVMIMMIRRYETKNRMLVITTKIIIIMKSNNWEKREKGAKGREKADVERALALQRLRRGSPP